jgi:hypothetical protein
VNISEAARISKARVINYRLYNTTKIIEKEMDRVDEMITYFSFLRSFLKKLRLKRAKGEIIKKWLLFAKHTAYDGHCFGAKM